MRGQSNDHFPSDTYDTRKLEMAATSKTRVTSSLKCINYIVGTVLTEPGRLPFRVHTCRLQWRTNSIFIRSLCSTSEEVAPHVHDTSAKLPHVDDWVERQPTGTRHHRLKLFGIPIYVYTLWQRFKFCMVVELNKRKSV